MDCIRGMFPFINAPLLNNSSISDLFSGCVACQPFGKVKTRSVEGCKKPSREVRTISSLVDKFAAACDQKSGHNVAPNRTLSASNTFYKPCSRQTSFSHDMNHEKFTPCAKNTGFYENDFRGNSIRSMNGGNYGKINFNCSDNQNCDKKGHEKPIMAPPRRKKRPAPKRFSEYSRDNSMESNLEHEIRKNHQNLKLNNLDQPNVFNTRQNRNINKNNNKGNRSVYRNVSCVTNNNINNKSGCSNLEVVSDSLVSNAMHFSKFDRVSDTANTITDNFEAGHCENKIYYKNSSFDRFGNYKHGNDLDEVIVCESVVQFDSRTTAVRRPTEHIPNLKNSTYTKFYTDSFYQDRVDDVISTRSLDEPFEQIVELQPDKNPFLQSAFAMLKSKKHPALEKQQQQQRQGLPNQPGHQREVSMDEDETFDQDNSIPVVFCGLLPIHQFNGGKWMQSVGALEVPEKWLANDGNNNYIEEERVNQFCKDIRMVTSENLKPKNSVEERDVNTYDKRIRIECPYDDVRGLNRCEIRSSKA